jgi:hypothetical protein
VVDAANTVRINRAPVPGTAGPLLVLPMSETGLSAFEVEAVAEGEGSLSR